MNNYAVVLLNLGGPDSLDAVQPFLFNLFSDSDIFKIPIGQKLFANIISKRRAPKVIEEYKHIGGNSPINKWTEIQRLNLEKELKNELNDVDVYTGMRYWNPSIKETAGIIMGKNYSKIIMLPLYPHYSITTTGSSFNEWKRYYKNGGNISYIQQYYENENYISAVNDKINQALLKFPKENKKKIVLVFSAHGTPVSLVEKGDPYNEHIKSTVGKVMEQRNYSHHHVLCYQSKVGPVKWLEPSTDQMIKKLSSEGNKHLLIIPISFVSDHVETLFELDIEYRKVADEAGIKNYIVMEGLNDSGHFITALKELVLKAIQKNSD